MCSNFVTKNEPRDLVEAITDYTGVTLEQARTRSRKRECVLFRYLYWYFKSQEDPTISHYILAAFFNRKRTTVYNGIAACGNKFDFKLQKHIRNLESLNQVKIV